MRPAAPSSPDLLAPGPVDRATPDAEREAPSDSGDEAELRRFELGAEDARGWFSSEPAKRDAARRRIRRTAAAQATFLDQPYVVVVDPAGNELERVPRGLTLELELELERGEERREELDPDLHARVLRICRRWMLSDRDAAEVDLMRFDGTLIETLDRRTTLPDEPPGPAIDTRVSSDVASRRGARLA